MSKKTGLLAVQKSLQIRELTEMEVKTNRELWAINSLLIAMLLFSK